MSGFIKALTETSRKIYLQTVRKDLAVYGLRVEDLMIEKPVVKEALSRLDATEKRNWYRMSC
jgi:hypothetical protein